MRKFQYNEMGDILPNGKIENIVVTITEQEIIEKYFPYWAHQMEKAGKLDLINIHDCIEDFIVCNWAWEI